MQTRLYSDLYALIQALCGISFSTSESIRIKSLINRRAERAYKASNYWTRFIVIGEERSLFSGDFTPSTSIVAGNRYIIQSVGNSNFVSIGAESNTVGVVFVATGVGSGTGHAGSYLGYVPYSNEISIYSVDSFLRIFSSKPYSSTTYGEYQFTVDQNGATLISGTSAPSSVYVTYKAQLQDQYGDGAGEVQTVPYEWFNYLAHGVYADFLRAEGQQEKCQMADAEANEILTDELMKLDEQHTQTIISNRISTNSSMQYRGMGYGS
jgi:hypothetical protein